MSRDTHKELFNCEQDNKAETSTNSCPTNKLHYERKEKLNAYKIAYGGVFLLVPRPTRVVPDQRPLNGCVRVCVFTFTRLLVCAVARGVPAERGDGSRGRLVRVADRRSQVRVRGVRRRVLSAAAGALHVDERLRQPRRRDLERAAHPRQK